MYTISIFDACFANKRAPFNDHTIIRKISPKKNANECLKGTI